MEEKKNVQVFIAEMQTVLDPKAKAKLLEAQTNLEDTMSLCIDLFGRKGFYTKTPENALLNLLVSMTETLQMLTTDEKSE